MSKNIFLIIKSVPPYEAGCCGYSAHRSFISFGWNSLVVNPADIHRKGKERLT
ncbi:hypothetical protein [Robertkochia solimangrovi]|uniref:hypothetical protein n=1 Tax=Robertkochia solimangrovi TaxID=2213046 RepID=UPI0013A5B9ED|nr:hypothetical protein [Robertkochia solimangrovi]